MATVDEILASMTEIEVASSTDEMLVIDANTRQISIPGSELIFGVEGDAGSERKYFLCPRYVGNNIDLASCFLRVSYRNANGISDETLVDDVAVNGDNITFSWEVPPKAVKYRGQVAFLVCAIGPNLKLAWHTTTASGIALEGIEPDSSHVETETSDVVAQLITMVEAQTLAVENTGAEQMSLVEAAAETAQASAVAEIEAKGVNTLATIPEDYTALSDAVDTLTRGRAGAIVCEVEGSVVSVSDASNLPMQGLRIFGRSTQDGTPTPDAPVEIVSVVEPVVTVAGKNLLPKSYKHGTTRTHSGLTYTVQEDGSVYVVGTVTDVESYFVLSDFNFGESSVGKGQSNGVYVWSDCLYNKAKHYTMLYFSQGKEVDQVFYPQVELGTVATEWESPVGQLITSSHTLPGIPVTSGGNYTDADGQQWICDEVDFERGVYVQRIHRMTLDGSSDESIVRQTISDSSKIRLLITNSSIATNSNAELGCAMCDCAPRVFAGEAGTYGGYQGISVDKSGNVHLFLDAICQMTEAEVREWLSANPIYIMYGLITPVETTLSETELAAYRELHTNYPNTTILNDSGAHMVVKYAADTKLYIDNKISALLGG